MADEKSSPLPFRPRKPMVVHRRPGSGGRQLNPFRPGFDEAAEGLAAYGEVSWRAVAGGARVGVIELGPQGDTYLMHRLSAYDVSRGDTLLSQIRPNLALAERFEELRPRLLILAYNMSGTREIRVPGVSPLPGELEREDVTLLLEGIEAGNCRHVIWRDGDRIARDVIPGELLLRELRRKQISCWLAGWGRKVDYRADRLALRATMMVSAEERENVVRRTQMGALNRGPLAGKGWLGAKRFGFVRDRRGYYTQDPKQTPWILRAFELADFGDCLEESGALSTRMVTDKLAAEGCPFDHDRVRTILKDPIHATGEYTVNIRGVPVSQPPVRLSAPVPLDRFGRVQQMLALRQGSTKRTPLGEFFLNYIETLHEPCQEERVHGNCQPMLRGYLRASSGVKPRYIHTPRVPTGCRGVTFERDDLEHPIIEAVRELAGHPEIVRQLQLAASHEAIATSPTRGPEQVEELQRTLTALEAQAEQITQEYVASLGHGAQANLEEYSALKGGLSSQIDQLRRQIAAAEHADKQQPVGGERSPKHEGRLEAFLEILTLDPPDDPYLKALRARMLQRILERVVIKHDGNGEGRGLVIELWGALVPEGASAVEIEQIGNPILANADLLDGEIRRRAGGGPAPELKPGGKRSTYQTDLSPKDEKSVWSDYAELQARPSVRQAVAEAAKQLDSTFWRSDHLLLKTGRSAWRLELIVPEQGDAGTPTPPTQAREPESGGRPSFRATTKE